MTQSASLSPDDIRSQFALALSRMYQTEVPLYGDLLDLVAAINADSPEHIDSARLDTERHGAIRLGTAAELAMMRRLFAVMGMQPVGYYDLSQAGLPVHATAFRPLTEASLARNPFRVFTSLLRLELIDDAALRAHASQILAQRQIFTPRCVALIEQAEVVGGLTALEAAEFIAEALHTFRWHGEATVDIDTYNQLKAAHPLIADVVCFKGPHINHLTPRVLDIDRAQAAMVERGIPAKDGIEGPPPRRCPILLRQTSFLALNEPIQFIGSTPVAGSHTARFGEIEQRGCALTRKGRALYDAVLAQSLQGDTAAFARFPDDWTQLRREALVYCRYMVGAAAAQLGEPPVEASADDLVEGGWLDAQPLTYEDFLPVSAAGIFRSNLRATESVGYAAGGNQQAFEAALGVSVCDEFELYATIQTASQAESVASLRAQAAVHA